MRSEEDGGAAQPSTEEDRDEQALQVFIISYRQFVSPTGFFTILEERCRSPSLCIFPSFPLGEGCGSCHSILPSPQVCQRDLRP